MTTWRREQKKARRAKRGVRRSSMWGSGVIPPSLGCCYLEVEDRHLARLDELIEFVHERGGRFVHQHSDRSVAIERIVELVNRYGYRSDRIGQYLIEIVEDELILIEFALMFE